MDDLISRDDEKAREVAREMGRLEENEKQKERELAAEKARKDEADRQREREQASEKGRREEQDRQRERDALLEKGRKQELEDERARQKKKGGWGSGIKIVGFIVLLLILLAVVAYVTLSVSVTNATPGNPMPYTSNYGVSFPEGQVIAIGNSHITVLSYQNELITDIDGVREKLVVGQPRVISDRRAVIRTFNSVTLMDTFFSIDLTYKGERDNRAYFDMAVHTSKQVPDVFLRNLLPPEIDARPI